MVRASLFILCVSPFLLLEHGCLVTTTVIERARSSRLTEELRALEAGLEAVYSSPKVNLETNVELARVLEDVESELSRLYNINNNREDIEKEEEEERQYDLVRQLVDILVDVARRANDMNDIRLIRVLLQDLQNALRGASSVGAKKTALKKAVKAAKKAAKKVGKGKGAKGGKGKGAKGGKKGGKKSGKKGGKKGGRK